MKMMGIKGVGGRLQVLGRVKMGGYSGKTIKRGGKEIKLPTKYDHFIITINERDEDTENFIPDKDLMAKYGEKPTEIPVLVPFDSIMAVFPHEYSWWTASKMHCHGNGEEGLRYNEASGEWEPCKCLCDKYTTKVKKDRVCSPRGILNIMLTDSARIGGVHQLRTGSINSIHNIVATLGFIKTATGGPLAGIPMTLTIQKKKAYPEGLAGGVDIYVAGLEYRGDPKSGLTGIQQLQARSREQVQARLTAGQDMQIIEQLSAGSLSMSEGKDGMDWEEEFPPGGEDTSGHIADKTADKTSDLKKRLDSATEAEYKDEPTTQTEPTTAEINANLRTEIETLLENKSLKKETVKKTTEWLKGNRQNRSLIGIRDKLVEAIDKLEKDADQEMEEWAGEQNANPTEDENRRAIRGDLAVLMKNDVLPRNTVTQLEEWLANEDLNADALAQCETKMIDMIRKYEAEPSSLIPDGTGERDSKESESPTAKSGRPSLAELGLKLSEMMGDAREKGLVTEQEYTDVFDESDKLKTAGEINTLHERWSETIEDRRSVRQEETDQTSGK